VANPSYYFTLFKKLQVLGHVPEGTHHGAGIGGFNLNHPSAVFGNTDIGSPLGGTNTASTNPLWAILNNKAIGGSGLIVIDGQPWPTMPLFDTPAWEEFQMNAPAPKLVSVLGNWITAGKTNDIPTGVLGQMPPELKKPRGEVSLFACNMAGDDGMQSVPEHYWATSLIFLVDPETGSTVYPAQLAGSDEYYLAAIFGNRGGTGAGRFLPDGGPKIECEAWVMVWNTGFSPAVKLPALSNLDIGAKTAGYEIYSLKPGAYDVAGFRLPVQTVFDGLVKAIDEADVDLGGLTPVNWIYDKNAHLCVRVIIRHTNQGWPAPEDTPLDSRRVAQRNLAPFAIDLQVQQSDPNIEWIHFMAGDGARSAGRDTRAGAHTLSIENHVRQPVAIYLAVPRRSFETIVDSNGIHGFEPVAFVDGTPFTDAVVLRCTAARNSIPVQALGYGRFLAALLGIEYSVSKLKKGLAGEVSVIQRTATPVLDPPNYTYQIEWVTTGGFTVEIGVL
jgi:hypothetical protein